VNEILGAVAAFIVFFIPAAIAAGGATLAGRAQAFPWRQLAYVPVLPLLVVGFIVFRDTQRDPTSHNLWPFEFALAGLICAALAGSLLVAHRLLARRLDR